jgi:hypothetical protein
VDLLLRHLIVPELGAAHIPCTERPGSQPFVAFEWTTGADVVNDVIVGSYEGPVIPLSHDTDRRNQGKVSPTSGTLTKVKHSHSGAAASRAHLSSRVGM